MKTKRILSLSRQTRYEKLSMTVELSIKTRYKSSVVCVYWFEIRPHGTNTFAWIHNDKQKQDFVQFICEILKRSRFDVACYSKNSSLFLNHIAKVICCENQLTSTFYLILTIHAVCFFFFLLLLLVLCLFLVFKLNFICYGNRQLFVAYKISWCKKKKRIF